MSDIDLIVIGAGTAYQLTIRDGRQVSVSWSSLQEDGRASVDRRRRATGCRHGAPRRSLSIRTVMPGGCMRKGRRGRRRPPSSTRRTDLRADLKTIT
jgi:hypothetical protein